MTKIVFHIALCIFLFGAFPVHGQSPKLYGNLVRIQSDSGVVKGELYETHDSALSILKRKQQQLILLPVSTINQLVIKSKPPVLLEIAKSTGYSALIIEILITWAYIRNASHYHYFFDKNDPPYWKSMVYGLPAGAILGFAGQSIETLFIRIRIPINKNQHIYENNRSRINKKSAYNSL